MKAKHFIIGGIFTYILGAVLTALPTFASILFPTLRLDYRIDMLLSILLVIIATVILFFILRSLAIKLLSVCKEIQAKRKLPIVLLGTVFFLLGGYTWIIILTQCILS